MELTLKTKFALGDKCFGFYNGRLWNFRIDDITVNHREGSFKTTQVSYKCTAVPPKDKEWECTFTETFEEHELYTKEEIIALLETVKNL